MNIKKTAVKSAIVAAALTAAVSAKDYSGAELYTNETWKYGKFEARMQMAAGSGTVSSMERPDLSNSSLHQEIRLVCHQMQNTIDIDEHMLLVHKNANDYHNHEQT